PYICDAGAYLQQASNAGKRIVLEAQLGAMRDIDYGIFPFTSSSNTLAAYAPLGAGIPNVKLDHVVGVLKAYSTCVGAGPFAAEKAMPENWMQALRKAGGEFGAATGRPRRVGPFDCVASRYGLACQGADKIALTKLDVLSGMKEIPVITGYTLDGTPVEAFDPTDDQDRMEPVVTMLPGWDCDISRCTRYDELPDTAKNYIEFLEKQLVHTIQFVSTGAAREQYLLNGTWL
ncbi:MAG: adenylosuccinate synthetase, partial [Subdoligranulum sp.]|nr:adenylosuccinate synthetase [Subdoligranulum sp.]